MSGIDGIPGDAAPIEAIGAAAPKRAEGDLKVQSLIEKVQQYTVSTFATVLCFFSIVGWAYLGWAHWQKGKAMEELKGIVQKPSQMSQAKYISALEILGPFKKFEDRRKNPQTFLNNMVSRGIRTVFLKEEWEKPEFRNQILPYYLALARAPEDETEALYNALPENIKIDRDKLAALREKIGALEYKMAELQTQPGFKKIIKDPQSAVETCIRDVFFPYIHIFQARNGLRNLFEAEVVSTFAAVFGDLWTPHFIRTFLPFYLELAAGDIVITEELLSLLPESIQEMIPPGPPIQPGKIEELKNQLAGLEARRKTNPTVQNRRSLNDCVQEMIVYQSQIPALMYSNMKMIHVYWDLEKYQTPHKTDTFKMTAMLRRGDGFDETLNTVDGYLSLDAALFKKKFKQWRESLRKASLEKGPFRSNEDFLKDCAKTYAELILTEYPEKARLELFNNAMKVRKVGSDKEAFMETAHQVHQMMERDENFTQLLKTWESGLHSLSDRFSSLIAKNPLNRRDSIG